MATRRPQSNGHKGGAAALLLLCCGWTIVEGGLDFGYHDNAEIEAFLRNLTADFPNITHMYSIGKTLEGRELWVLTIGVKPREYVPLRPDVKYVGNMHGNEITNRELLLHLAEYLLTNYGQNETVTSLLTETRIHVLPSMNPDGAEMASRDPAIGDFRAWNGTTNATLTKYLCMGTSGRTNTAGVDLNRNFPDYFEGNPTPRQPETRAIMEWLTSYQFVLSANLHGGALLANYPLDSYVGAPSADWKARYSAAPDDDVFKHLARSYSYSHPTMSSGIGCPGNGFPSSFPEGKVNGAQWYPVIGGMQDYNYIYSGCMELTLELHCCKYAPTWYIWAAWEENREAFVKYLQQAHMGVKGRVSDTNKLEIKNAEVTVKGREFFVLRTTPNGEFWRLLLPGDYTLMVKARGYVSRQVAVQVNAGSVTQVQVVLTRGQQYGPLSGVPSANLSNITDGCIPSSAVRNSILSWTLFVVVYVCGQLKV